MNIRSIFGVFSFVFALNIFAAEVALGQGVIVPVFCPERPCRPIAPPRPHPIPAALPVKSINLTTRIKGQVAETRVEQIFRNDTPFTLEGTYFFPIPDGASVTAFSIWENGKKLSGEIRSREEARRIYDEIVRRRRDPGLLEYAGKDLFQASIFPIPPNSDKKLEMVYSQVLKANSGSIGYRYSLGNSGTAFPIQVPEARSLDDDARGPTNSQNGLAATRITGRVEISDGAALQNIYSPTYDIKVDKTGETSATVSFESARPNGDFQLFYSVSGREIEASLITSREADGDGYFLLLLSPNSRVSDEAIVSKDIVFVLDTSGSMADEGKIEKARAALLFGINTLRSGDRFNVISFAGETHQLMPDLIAADDDGKRRGRDFVQKLQPGGGTNISEALGAAVRQFDNSDRPKMLVFLTDGLPTVGERDPQKIADGIGAPAPGNVRIFPFGVGYDVNAIMLDRLAAQNGGITEYVQPKEDLEVKLSGFFERVSSPVLTDLTLNFGAVETDLIYPRQLSDIFRGEQALIVGRYKNDADIGNATITLAGRMGSESRTFRYDDLNFPRVAENNEFLPRLWATRRVAWLVEQIRINGENAELRDEVVELGTRYGIVTPYTSILAIDGAQAGAMRRGEEFSRGALAVEKKMRIASGADAVQQSVNQNALRKNSVLAASPAKDGEPQVLVADSSTNRFVGAKNFFKDNGVWVDAEYSPTAKLPETSVKFASDEYFALASSQKGIGRYLALGESVIVVWRGRVYRVAP